MAGILFIISAPSGSGKSTLVNQLRTLVRRLGVLHLLHHARLRVALRKKVASITSPTAHEFERMIAAGEFLEYAEVFGNYYGTARQTPSATRSARAKTSCSTSMCRARRRSAKDCRMPSASSSCRLHRRFSATRLRNRSRAEGHVEQEVIDRRLAKARQEIENYRQYGYILVNDILDRAVEELEAIVSSERIRRSDSTNRRRSSPADNNCRSLPAATIRCSDWGPFSPRLDSWGI